MGARTRALLLALCLTVPLAGCRAKEKPAPPAPEPPSSTASAPAEEEPEEMERVVSLNPSVTEILFDLGLGDRVAGVGGFCAPPQERPRCGIELDPDVGAIRALDAQLVLTLTTLPDSALAALGEAGVPVVSLEKPDNPENYPAYYERIAAAVLGEEAGAARAEGFAAPLMETFEAVRSAAAAVPQDARPAGAFAALLPLTLATGDSLQGRVLEWCGVRNVAAEYTDWQYPQELLLPLDPEILVVDARTVSADDVRAHPNYSTTRCVTQERLLEVDGAALENAGRRFFETLLEIARFALPDAGLPESPGEEAGRGASPPEDEAAEG